MTLPPRAAARITIVNPAGRVVSAAARGAADGRTVFLEGAGLGHGVYECIIDISAGAAVSRHVCPLVW